MYIFWGCSILLHLHQIMIELWAQNKMNIIVGSICCSNMFELPLSDLTALMYTYNSIGWISPIFVAKKLALSTVVIEALLLLMIFFISPLKGVLLFISLDYLRLVQKSSKSDIATFMFRWFIVPVAVVLLPQLINRAMRSNDGFDFVAIQK